MKDLIKPTPTAISNPPVVTTSQERSQYQQQTIPFDWNRYETTQNHEDNVRDYLARLNDASLSYSAFEKIYKNKDMSERTYRVVKEKFASERYRNGFSVEPDKEELDFRKWIKLSGNAEKVEKSMPHFDELIGPRRSRGNHAPSRELHSIVDSFQINEKRKEQLRAQIRKATRNNQYVSHHFWEPYRSAQYGNYKKALEEIAKIKNFYGDSAVLDEFSSVLKTKLYKIDLHRKEAQASDIVFQETKKESQKVEKIKSKNETPTQVVSKISEDEKEFREGISSDKNFADLQSAIAIFEPETLLQTASGSLENQIKTVVNESEKTKKERFGALVGRCKEKDIKGILQWMTSNSRDISVMEENGYILHTIHAIALFIDKKYEDAIRIFGQLKKVREKHTDFDFYELFLRIAQAKLYPYSYEERKKEFKGEKVGETPKFFLKDDVTSEMRSKLLFDPQTGKIRIDRLHDVIEKTFSGDVNAKDEKTGTPSILGEKPDLSIPDVDDKNEFEKWASVKSNAEVLKKIYDEDVSERAKKRPLHLFYYLQENIGSKQLSILGLEPDKKDRALMREMKNIIQENGEVEISRWIEKKLQEVSARTKISFFMHLILVDIYTKMERYEQALKTQRIIEKTFKGNSASAEKIRYIQGKMYGFNFYHDEEKEFDDWMSVKGNKNHVEAAHRNFALISLQGGGPKSLYEYYWNEFAKYLFSPVEVEPKIYAEFNSILEKQNINEIIAWIKQKRWEVPAESTLRAVMELFFCGLLLHANEYEEALKIARLDPGRYGLLLRVAQAKWYGYNKNEKGVSVGKILASLMGLFGNGWLGIGATATIGVATLTYAYWDRIIAIFKIDIAAEKEKVTREIDALSAFPALSQLNAMNGLTIKGMKKAVHDCDDSDWSTKQTEMIARIDKIKEEMHKFPFTNKKKELLNILSLMKKVEKHLPEAEKNKLNLYKAQLEKQQYEKEENNGRPEKQLDDIETDILNFKNLVDAKVTLEITREKLKKILEQLLVAKKDARAHEESKDVLSSLNGETELEKINKIQTQAEMDEQSETLKEISDEIAAISNCHEEHKRLVSQLENLVTTEFSQSPPPLSDELTKFQSSVKKAGQKHSDEIRGMLFDKAGRDLFQTKSKEISGFIEETKIRIKAEIKIIADQKELESKRGLLKERFGQMYPKADGISALSGRDIPSLGEIKKFVREETKQKTLEKKIENEKTLSGIGDLEKTLEKYEGMVFSAEEVKNIKERYAKATKKPEIDARKSELTTVVRVQQEGFNDLVAPLEQEKFSEKEVVKPTPQKPISLHSYHAVTAALSIGKEQDFATIVSSLGFKLGTQKTLSESVFIQIQDIVRQAFFEKYNVIGEFNDFEKDFLISLGNGGTQLEHETGKSVFANALILWLEQRFPEKRFGVELALYVQNEIGGVTCSHFEESAFYKAEKSVGINIPIGLLLDKEVGGYAEIVPVIKQELQEKQSETESLKEKKAQLSVPMSIETLSAMLDWVTQFDETIVTSGNTITQAKALVNNKALSKDSWLYRLALIHLIVRATLLLEGNDNIWGIIRNYVSHHFLADINQLEAIALDLENLMIRGLQPRAIEEKAWFKQAKQADANEWDSEKKYLKAYAADKMSLKNTITALTEIIGLLSKIERDENGAAMLRETCFVLLGECVRYMGQKEKTIFNEKLAKHLPKDVSEQLREIPFLTFCLQMRNSFAHEGTKELTLDATQTILQFSSAVSLMLAKTSVPSVRGHGFLGQGMQEKKTDTTKDVTQPNVTQNSPSV